MRSLNKLGMVAVAIVFSVTMAAAKDIGPTSYSGFIQDTYIGKDTSKYGLHNSNYSASDGDIIGDPLAKQTNNMFSIFSLDFVKTGNKLVIKINTNFVANDWFTYGDLFISNGYTPMSREVSRYDANSNNWDYAFHMDKNDGFAGSGDLYTYSAADAIMSGDRTYISYRNGQITGIKSNTATKVANNGGSWLRYGSYIQYTFDLTDTTLLNATALSFRWTMSCANDIIQGGYDNGSGGGNGLNAISEPATLGLFGLCLVGFGCIRRRKVA